MIKVGLREGNFPTDEETMVLFEFINKHFANFSPGQIDEAFDLAITGQLPIKDSGCYENFSCEYFGRIMAGYRSYLINTGRVQKNTDIERHRRQETQNELPASVADYAPQGWDGHIAELRAKVQSGDSPSIIPTAIYDWLERQRLLKYDFGSFLTDARQAVLTKLREEKHAGQMDGKNINSILADLEGLAKDETHHKIIIQAKRMAILKYLQNSKS